MSYRAPVEDIRFVLRELAGLEAVLALPGYEDVPADVVDAVLEEHARFVEQAVAPLDVPGDRHPAAWDEGSVRTPPGFRQAHAAFVRAGWQGLPHDAAHGGQGLPRMVGAATSETINSACMSFALCSLLTDGVIDVLLLAGSPEQQARYLPALMEGRWTGTMNLTEPAAGSDLALLTSTARPVGDGSYRISGQKIFITYGEHDMADNIVHLVLARTPDAPAGVRGISLFLVPKYLVDDSGEPGARNDVWCASLEHKLGIHGSPTAVLLYGQGGAHSEIGEGAVGYLVGEENRGLEIMFIMMNAARFAVGVQGVAACERAWQKAAAYAAERMQGRAVEGSPGPVPIAHHPDVQRLLGTMRALTEGSRALALVAAGERDRATHETTPEARARHQAVYEYCVPIVKAFCTEVAVEAASLGVQVHGGMGFIEEAGAAQVYRDARILPIYEGTTAIQANDFIGRKIGRDGGAVARSQMAAMRETLEALRQVTGPDGAALALIAARLADAVDAYEASVNQVLDQLANDVRAAFQSSVPLLMLAGTVHAGWQMARAALAAHRHREQGTGDDFHGEKLATAVLYATQVLPRAAGHASTIADSTRVQPFLDGI
ncbi:MAG: acyl-CoA dehydrogenase [Castellaniella sp.]